MAYADSMRDQMKDIAGIQSIEIVEVDAGEAVGMAKYDSQSSADAAVPTVQQIMGGMAQFFTGPPELKDGPTMWSM